MLIKVTYVGLKSYHVVFVHGCFSQNLKERGVDMVVSYHYHVLKRILITMPTRRKVFK